MIGKFIQEKRKEAGFTQAQLAEYLGVSAPAVNKWEKDMCYPDASLIAPLARLLKTDLNEMFSFYSVLSDKERELITDDIYTAFLKEGSKEGFEKVKKALLDNPRDGLLFKQIADKLYGLYLMKKSFHPLWHLKEIAGYYERAMELSPELTDDISISLMTVYAELGEKEKAEDTWQKFSETRYNKEWAHADLMYLLKDYDRALSETKINILKDVIELYNLLDFLKELFEKTENPDMAALTEEKRRSLAEVFSLWNGMENMSMLRKNASEGQGLEEISVISGIIDMISMDDTISSCPIFEGVSLGGNVSGDSSSADVIADIIEGVKKLKKGTTGA